MVKDCPWLDVGPPIIAALLLLLYHLYLAYRTRTAPLTTAIGLTNQTRQVWVKMIMQEKRDILAIQTLRNWIMASSFLASTAMLVSLGLLSLAAAPEEFRKIATLLSVGATDSRAWWEIKVLMLVLNFFAAFFNFSLAIRYFNHVNFMINIPVEPGSSVTPESVAKTLNRGAIHYTFGMRGYYLAIPLTLWLVGSPWLLLGATILVVILYRLDRPV